VRVRVQCVTLALNIIPRQHEVALGCMAPTDGRGGVVVGIQVAVNVEYSSRGRNLTQCGRRSADANDKWNGLKAQICLSQGTVKYGIEWNDAQNEIERIVNMFDLIAGDSKVQCHRGGVS
jgi:hypothetical protein